MLNAAVSFIEQTLIRTLHCAACKLVCSSASCHAGIWKQSTCLPHWQLPDPCIYTCLCAPDQCLCIHGTLVVYAYVSIVHKRSSANEASLMWACSGLCRLTVTLTAAFLCWQKRVPVPSLCSVSSSGLGCQFNPRSCFSYCFLELH